MKKQVTWIGLLLSLFFFAACEKPVLESNDGNKTSNKAKDNLTRVVRIHPKELRVETVEEAMSSKPQPLSRAAREESKKKFYAVNVYEKKPSDENYSMYAYGLFTSPSKIALRMNAANHYKVECLIVEEADDKVYTNNGEYLAPFLHGANKGTKATNTFVFSKDENLNSLTKGETAIAAGRTNQYPRVVKLYGTINDFSPKATKDLTVDMKRAVFGLHFKITPPNEGKLVISYVGWHVTLTKNSDAYDNRATYAFSDILKACQDGYQTTIEVKAVWTKDDGTVEEESKQLLLKRNVMTVVNVKVEGQNPKSFTFREEEGNMTTENVEWDLSL